jgi:hypothetical protein
VGCAGGGGGTTGGEVQMLTGSLIRVDVVPLRATVTATPKK